MHDAPHTATPRARRFLYAVSGVLVIAGCQSSPVAPPTQEQPRAIAQVTEHIEAPIRRLQAQAELESISPSEPIDESVLQRILPEPFTPLAPGSADHQRAMLPLARVLALLPERQIPDPPNAPSPERAQQAAKLYTSARVKRQSKETEMAIDDLIRATNLDPSSPRLFNALGDAYIDLDDRMSAVGAYEQAADLGGATARALVLLASEAAGRQETEPALQYASQALGIESNDPLTHPIAGLLAGSILIDNGRLLAGATALSTALDSFDTTSRDPRWRAEIIQFHTQRTALWIGVGDAWSALGASARASESYAKASTPDQPSPYPLVARLVVTHLRAGQPAVAALAFLDHLDAAPARTSLEERQWASALSSIDALGDIIPDAVRELRVSSTRTASDQQALIRVELGSRTNAGRVETLAGASPSAVTPVVAAEALAGIADDTERFDACVAVLRVNPAIAQPLAAAFVRSLAEPMAFLRAHALDTDPTHRLLLERAAIELGRADIIQSTRDPPADSVVHLGSVAQIAALTGDLATANTHISTLRAIDTPQATRALARTLLSAQQPSQAWDLISEYADYSDASVEDLHTAAAIAVALNKHQPARSYLERLLELDPTFEEGYEQLIILHSPGAPLADEEEHRRVVRQLTTLLPRSDLLMLVRANQLAGGGRLHDAESLIVKASARSPQRDIGISLLLGVWTALDEAGDEQAIERAEQWLTGHLARTPTSNAARSALARIYLQQELPEQALALFDEGYARTGSFELARSAEQILVSLGREDEAAQRAIERTADLRSTDAVLAHAERLAQSGDPDGSISALSNHLSDQIELLPSQRDRLGRTLFLLAGDPAEPDASEPWLELYDLAEGHLQPVAFPLVRLRLLMLADLHPTDHARLVALTAEALDGLDQAATEQQRNAVEVMAVQRLLANERKQDAFVVLHKLATRGGEIDDRLAIEILRFVGGIGDGADATRAIDRLARDNLLDEVIAIADEQLGLPSRDRPATTENERKADLAYTISSIAQAFDRTETTIELFELTLSYDAAHPWANNDYGYMLIERHERLDEAEQMLVRAVDALPNSSSVLDSLGWARYKRGRLSDVPKDGGQLVTEGAVTLLKRAILAESEGDAVGNATIHDHLGDTHWRLEEFDLAVQSWLDAERILRSRIQQASTLDDVNQQALDRLSTNLRDIRLKISDAESGAAPKLAPIPGWEDPVATKPQIKPKTEIDPGK